MASAPPLSEATNGDETVLRIKLPGASAFTEIGEITDLPELPSGTQSTYKTTHMKSGKYEEHKKNKRRDGAEVTITGNYVIGGAAEAALEAAEDAGGALEYQIDAVQGDDVFRFQGFALFMNLKRTNPAAAARQFSIVAKWVGDAVQSPVA